MPGRGLTATAVVRVLAGLLHLAAAIPRLTAHCAEIDVSSQFGLPRSRVLVPRRRPLESSGALLLLLGLAARPAADT